MEDYFNYQELNEELQKTFEQITIRVQARNARKSITSIHGIPSSVDCKDLLKDLKKYLNCNGFIYDDSIIKLTGNHSKKLDTYLSRAYPDLKIVNTC
jgi:translation initiation factor SUI1